MTCVYLFTVRFISCVRQTDSLPCVFQNTHGNHKAHGKGAVCPASTTGCTANSSVQCLARLVADGHRRLLQFAVRPTLNARQTRTFAVRQTLTHGKRGCVTCVTPRRTANDPLTDGPRRPLLFAVRQSSNARQMSRFAVSLILTHGKRPYLPCVSC